jgi:hypothetical protein
MNLYAPVYYPLFGELDGEFSYIMVARQGQSNDQTLKEWQLLMKNNGILFEEGNLVLSKDYDLFLQVMSKAGWKKEFIAFGP